MLTPTPVIVRPDIVTVLPVPTLLLSKVPTAEPVFSVTESPPTTPTRAAEPVLRIAAVVPSYTLLSAVMPDTVRAFGMILAVGVGWVSE